MSIKVNDKQTVNKYLETNNTTSINQLPKTIQQTLLSYLSKREEASLHLVQHAWQHLERMDGYLDLSNRDITDRDLAQIVNEYKNAHRKLVSINLSGCSKITDQSLKFLSHFPTLQQIDLGKCFQITDKGLGFLSHLSLKQLNLWHCLKITDKGLEILSHVPTLQKLNIGHCYKITDKGLGFLSQLTLQELDLARVYKITDKGLEFLSQLPLKQLNLWGCSKITDQSLQMLSQLPLEKLNLDLTKINDPKRMSEVLPLSHFFHENDVLQSGSLARQAEDYSDLYNLVLEHI